MTMQGRLLEGDRVLWALLGLLALFSFFPIFSARSNLSYVIGNGSPWQYLLKHTFILITGLLVSFFLALRTGANLFDLAIL